MKIPTPPPLLHLSPLSNGACVILRRRSATGRRRSSLTVNPDKVNGVDGAGGSGDVGDEDDGEGECWHELKDEDGSGSRLFQVLAVKQCLCQTRCRVVLHYYYSHLAAIPLLVTLLFHSCFLVTSLTVTCCAWQNHSGSGTYDPHLCRTCHSQTKGHTWHEQNKKRQGICCSYCHPSTSRWCGHGTICCSLLRLW